jgi:hypothetical protein
MIPVSADIAPVSVESLTPSRGSRVARRSVRSPSEIEDAADAPG